MATEGERQKKVRAGINARGGGCRAIKGRKELDHIAYLRYAMVYLRMDGRHTVRNEIDHLLAEEAK